jgi:hypothetical protein
MATREGYEEFSVSSGSGSLSLTVPANTTYAVVTVAGYYGTADYLAGATQMDLDSTAMTVIVNGDTDSNAAICIWGLANPSTGSVSLAYTWKSEQAPAEGLGVYAVYYSGIDVSGGTAAAVRSSGTHTASGTSHSIGTLTAQSGDVFVGASQDYSNTDQTSWTNATEVDSQLYRSDWLEWAEDLPSGNTAYSVTCGDSYSGMCGAVLKGAAAAGGNAPTGHLYGPLVGSLGGPI